jgi:hypothetical protein
MENGLAPGAGSRLDGSDISDDAFAISEDGFR